MLDGLSAFFIRREKTPASIDGEYNQLVSLAGVFPRLINAPRAGLEFTVPYKNFISFNGQYRNTAFPRISSLVTKLFSQNRESLELFRLSPMTK